MEERHDFYKWVGICITQWASIESKLFRICHCTHQTDKQTAAIVFFRTPTLETRWILSMSYYRWPFQSQERMGVTGTPSSSLHWARR
jgi:hypothetical protein